MKDTLCVLPWINIEARNLGDLSACCHSARALQKEDGTSFHLSRDTLREAFHSADLKKIRSNLKKGIKDKNCSRCWRNEAAGLPSRRQRFNTLFADLLPEIKNEKLEPEQPLILDIKLGNACNLKCRICGPASSSLWEKEYADIYGPEALQLESAYRLEKLEELQAWLPKVTRLELSGGEPFLNLKYFALLQESVQKGYAKNQELQIASNGTLFPERWVKELFPHFRKVEVLLSIDGVEKQFEYQRHPANWSTVFANYQKFKESGFFAGITLTVSLFNIYFISDYLAFWQKHGEERVNTNILHSPSYLSIYALPKEMKAHVCGKIFSHPGLSPKHQSLVLHLMEAIMQADGEAHWPVFLRVLAEHDRYRKEKYADLFSEFAAIF